MKGTIAFLLSLLLPAVLFAQDIATGEQSIAIEHVTIIDMTGAKPRADMTVAITRNKITAIGKTGKTQLPKNTKIVDGTGKFLIPGLWDMHTHSVWGESGRKLFLPLNIANGVTGVRDMFSDCYPKCPSTGEWMSLEGAREWGRLVADGSLVGPRIIASSPIIDGPAAIWPGSYIVKNADEGRAAVRYVKQHGHDFIKVYSFLSRESYFAIAQEANKQGLVFAGHVPNTVSAGEASDAGQKSIEHLTGILLACSTDEESLRAEISLPQDKRKLSNGEVAQRTLDTYSEKKASALFRRFVRNKTWMSPTLVVLRSMSFLDDKNFTSDVRLKYLPPSFGEEWKPENDPRFKSAKAEDYVVYRRRLKKYIEVVGAMHRAGVQIIAGTDTPNPYCFPGFSLHDELELYVQAGLTPLEALQTATINPAKYLDKTDSLGTIEKGKSADLVLLDANPLVEVGNTRRIAAVFGNGRYLSRETLAAMLEEVEKSSNAK